MKNLKIKIDLGNIMLWYTTFVLCFFVGFLSFIRFILPTNIDKIFLSGTTVLAIIIYIVVKRKSIIENIVYSYVLLAVGMICFAYANSAWSVDLLFLFASSIMLCIIALSEEKIIQIIKAALLFLMIMDLFYGFVTIVCFFNGDFYTEKIIPLFPWAIDRLIRQYNSGCIAGITSHYSTNAMFLSTGLLIAIAMFLKQKQKRYLLSAIILFVSLLMTGKRAHILFSAFAIFFIYFISLIKQGLRRMILNTVVVMLITIIVAGVFFLLFPSLATFIQRFKETIDAGDISLGRFDFWTLALNAFKENPLLGIGWKHYQIDINPGYDVHNVYLQIICETGVVGAIIFFAWFILLYWKTLRNYIKIISCNNDNLLDDKYLVYFSFLYQTFFFLYCFTGNPLYETIMFVPYFISCMITICFSKHMKGLEKNITLCKRGKIYKWW